MLQSSSDGHERFKASYVKIQDFLTVLSKKTPGWHQGTADGEVHERWGHWEGWSNTKTKPVFTGIVCFSYKQKLTPPEQLKLLWSHENSTHRGFKEQLDTSWKSCCGCEWPQLKFSALLRWCRGALRVRSVHPHITAGFATQRTWHYNKRTAIKKGDSARSSHTSMKASVA